MAGTLVAHPELKVSIMPGSGLADVYAVGPMVLPAEGSKAKQSHDESYQQICVPEYETANGHLHHQAVLIRQTLPTKSGDPNLCRRVRRRCQLNSFLNSLRWGDCMRNAG